MDRLQWARAVQRACMRSNVTSARVQDLHSVCGDVAWLQWALELQAAQDTLFWDSAAGAAHELPCLQQQDAGQPASLPATSIPHQHAPWAAWQHHLTSSVTSHALRSPHAGPPSACNSPQAPQRCQG